MELTDCYRILSDRIISDDCVIFIGAGVSTTYNFEGRTYRGLPLSRQLLDKLKGQRQYLREVEDIGQAAFLMKHNEGRTALENFLRNELSPKSIKPLPAHTLLSELNVTSYISMNFDTLLEQALEQSSKPFLQVVEDSDIPLLGREVIPVIKPHGSVDRPSTLCIATDETLNFDERTPIISKFMCSLLANKTALFLGFSLADSDFMMLLRYLKKTMGEYMPKSIAVMKNSQPFLNKFWDEHNVTIIEEDLTNFLRELSATVKKQRFQLEENLEPWMKNPFFWELLDIRGLPTETQVIDAFLHEVKRRISAGEEIDPLKSSVDEAISLVLSYRKNYAALKSIGERLDSIFSTCIQEGIRPWDKFIKLEKKRIKIKDEINSKANETIGDAKNIVLYSQSQRVVDLLLALDPTIQREITLYLGECRPKSPKYFQDAILTARLLKDSDYKINFIPDMTIFHLIQRNTIDLILMGAHSVIKIGDSYKYFINTCGSEPIVLVASHYNIPLKLVFEKEKEETLENENSTINISYEEEENIASSIITEISLDPNLEERIRVVNIGYDLVNWRNNIIAITD